MFVITDLVSLPSMKIRQYLWGVTLMTRNARPALSTSIVASFALSLALRTRPAAGVNAGS